MSIDPFLSERQFKPETLAVMREAFDRARKSLRGLSNATLALEIVASRIERQVRAGEKDVRKLCEDSLKGFGVPSECSDATL